MRSVLVCEKRESIFHPLVFPAPCFLHSFDYVLSENGYLSLRLTVYVVREQFRKFLRILECSSRNIFVDEFIFQAINN